MLLMHNACSIWSIFGDVINILSLDNGIYMAYEYIHNCSMAYVNGTKTPAKVVNVNARQLAFASSGIWCRPHETKLRHSYVHELEKLCWCCFLFSHINVA